MERDLMSNPIIHKSTPLSVYSENRYCSYCLLVKGGCAPTQPLPYLHGREAL